MKTIGTTLYSPQTGRISKQSTAVRSDQSAMKNDDICYLRLRLALYGSFMALYDLWRYLCSSVTSCVSLLGG